MYTRTHIGLYPLRAYGLLADFFSKKYKWDELHHLIQITSYPSA